MVEGARQSTDQPFLLFLLFFLEVKNSLWAWDTSATRRLRSFPSWTHLSTSWRSCIGTYKVRVRFSSFQVRRATSWVGPSWAQRHRGLPHRFFVILREARTKGFIFLRRSRACFPRLFVIKWRAINISIHTFQTMSTKKSSLRKNIFCSTAYIEKREDWRGLDSRKIFTLHCWNFQLLIANFFSL